MSFSLLQTSSAFSDDEVAWAFTASSPAAPSASPSKKSSMKSPKSKSKSSKNKKMTREEQEEADYQYALKLSRGEIPDSKR